MKALIAKHKLIVEILHLWAAYNFTEIKMMEFVHDYLVCWKWSSERLERFKNDLKRNTLVE